MSKWSDFWSDLAYGAKDSMKGVKNVFNAFTHGRFNDDPNAPNGAEKIGSFFNDLTGVTSANRFNAQQAQIDRDFQSAQAKLAYDRELEADATKYQRTVSDLKNAGINPMMAVGGMSAGSVGSSAPAGSSASSVGASGSTIISAVLRGASQLVSSAIKASNNIKVNDARNSIANVIAEGKNRTATDINSARNAYGLERQHLANAGALDVQHLKNKKKGLHVIVNNEYAPYIKKKEKKK